MPTDDLTGVWSADDGGYYYIRQIQDAIWWVGFSQGWRFHPGVDFTNVFRGHLNQTTNSIEGDWVDVPRGNYLQSGTITLDLVEVETDTPSGGAGGHPPPVDSPGGGTMLQTELHKRPGTGGPFGASIWRRPFYPLVGLPPFDLDFRMKNTQRNDGGSMADHLKRYKDYVVVFGEVRETWGVGYPPATPIPYTYGGGGPGSGIYVGPPYVFPIVSRDYCSFIATPWWPYLAGDPPDGDIDFRIQVYRNRNDVPALFDLERQPGFWSDGWLNNLNEIRNKLEDDTNNQQNWMHPEIIMYGRDTDADHCGEDAATLFPGWMEDNGNSVLLNGRPIEGAHPGNVEFGPTVDQFGRPIAASPVRLLGQPLPVGTRVRVTGLLALDCHGLGCDEDDPSKHNVELHPVYAIDILQDFQPMRPAASLSGVWHADDVGTYYIRQIGDTIWWLGLSRDQGQTFANIFQGRMEQDSIVGEWADVPVGNQGTRSHGILNLTTADNKGIQSVELTRVSGTGGFGGARWGKLRDRIEKGPVGSE